ncbi:hypothetical protein BHM03_00054106 [Ensete ventricosum]|nr:hypothetical protein BHM03_00054106 [Ensete ventricosum]
MDMVSALRSGRKISYTTIGAPAADPFVVPQVPTVSSLTGHLAPHHVRFGQNRCVECGEDLMLSKMVRNRDKSSRSWSLVYGPSQDGTRAALELDQKGKVFLLC